MASDFPDVPRAGFDPCAACVNMARLRVKISFLLRILGLGAIFFGGTSRAEEIEKPPLSLASAVQAGARVAWSGNGREQLTVTIENRSDQPRTVVIPAGTILQSVGGGVKIVIVREAQLAMAVGGSAKAELRTAALSVKNDPLTRAFTPIPDSAPPLAPLLTHLATHPDFPPLSAQAAVLSLLENVTFPQWQQFLAKQRAEGVHDAASAAVETAQTIGGLELLRAVAPEQHFALVDDTNLKLLALRNPLCRAKAAEIYGLVEPVLPPKVGELLHVAPNDNCPICRQRSQMGRATNNF